MMTTDIGRADRLWRQIASVASPKRRSTSPTHKSAYCQLLGCTERELMLAARVLHNRDDVVTIDLGDTIAFSMRREPPEQSQLDFHKIERGNQ